MKKGAKLLFLVSAVMLLTLTAGNAFGVKPPPNKGTPLPASWNDYPWEIEHIVGPGEFLYMLAGFYYRDGRKWNWIYELNREIIGENPNKIKPGQKLIIRVPRNWEPPMPYSLWLQSMGEQYLGTGGGSIPATLGNEEGGT